jgi:hypothetical protein
LLRAVSRGEEADPQAQIGLPSHRERSPAAQFFEAFDARDRLEVGGFVIDDLPSYRVDNMPYDGVTASALRWTA